VLEEEGRKRAYREGVIQEGRKLEEKAQRDGVGRGCKKKGGRRRTGRVERKKEEQEKERGTGRGCRNKGRRRGDRKKQE
jgi:hypothetical protein